MRVKEKFAPDLVVKESVTVRAFHSVRSDLQPESCGKNLVVLQLLRLALSSLANLSLTG